MSTTSINELLHLIDVENRKLDTGIWVASQPSNLINIKTLNATHTKNILKSAIEGIFVPNQFNMVMYHVLTDIVDSTIPLSTLSVYDKSLILLQLRQYNIAPTISVKLTNAQGNTLQHEVVLSDLIDRNKIKPYPSEHTITAGKFSVTLNLPSITTEYMFDSHLYANKIANISDQNKSVIKELFGPIFIYNIAQYIQRVQFGDVDMDISTVPVDARLKIVEKLPANILDKIITTIEKRYTVAINEITAIEYTVEGQLYSGNIELSPELFIS